jgi:hypothetical protein
MKKKRNLRDIIKYFLKIGYFFLDKKRRKIEIKKKRNGFNKIILFFR